MSTHEMEAQVVSGRGQMATSQHQEPCNMTQEHKASTSFVDENAGLNRHCGGQYKTGFLSGRARVLRTRKRGEELEAQYHSDYQGGLVARRDLSRHISQSLPSHLRTSESNLHKFWYEVHCRVAVFALNRADRSARRLDLKRVPDKSRFLRDHCNWYRYFCSFSDLVFPG